MTVLVEELVATTRIHDLAAEFGISSEQLMGMLKEMDIFVRSHLTPLKDEQVSLMRARWERDKRKQKQPSPPPKWLRPKPPRPSARAWRSRRRSASRRKRRQPRRSRSGPPRCSRISRRPNRPRPQRQRQA